jgi:DNA-binding CsgD family transcriptional regulator/PAS domain-containing protein
MSSAGYEKVVSTIYEAVLDEPLTAAALQAVAEYVSASSASYLIVNKLTRQVSSVTRWGSFTGSRSEYLAYFSKIDRFRAILEEAECGKLFRLSDCLSQSVLRHDEWYNDYILKGGACDVLGTKLSESRSHMVIAGFHRAVGDPLPFPGDLAALRRLMPTLSNAARLHIGLIDNGYYSAIVHGKLDHLAAGVIFTDADGRIVETNQAAEHILRRGDGLTIHDGQICARRNFETAKLAELIAGTTNKNRGRPWAGCLLIGRDGGRPSYVVRVAPISAGLADLDPSMAMVLISAPDENRVSESELSELYGLSPAEARLAVAVAFGKRLSELAREFGVQITTLRTQLSSVLKKCEVERQSDLVRLISNIPVVRLASSQNKIV